MPLFCCCWLLPFASNANSKWKDFLFNKMNTIYDRIRHEGRYIISLSRLKMPSFVLCFCNWLSIRHLKDQFEASEWKSLETRFVQFYEYNTRDMIWWYIKNLSHLVERSIISEDVFFWVLQPSPNCKKDLFETVRLKGVAYFHNESE